MSSPFREWADRPDDAAITELCEHIAGGESLLSFSRLTGFPYRTIGDWIDADASRVANYARAREAQADFHFDKLDDVSEDAAKAESAVEVAGLRLKADNIKWKLARMAPKRYGDKLELAGSKESPLTVVIQRLTDG